ncbi:MAG: DUF599 domain-containing protein [Theionarchaea archaeon]|nr:MAG: hypothetical protein AYK18_14645 [Theionarchaea archaeon DG-70]MBU7010628.1 DUF599 domain-containing protein [Theionarchaea archaeon]
MDIEYVSGITFALIFAGYNLSYFQYVKTHPLKTQKGRHNIYRQYWIENVLKRGKGMVAIQQIRNMTTITTFLASSTLIFMGVAVSYGASFLVEHDYVDYKLSALIGIIALAFFNFLFTLRTVNQITILIESSPSKIEELEGKPAVQYLTQKVNQAFFHHTLGMRCLYYSIPLFFWFFDPLILVVITIVLTLGIAKYLDF